MGTAFVFWPSGLLNNFNFGSTCSEDSQGADKTLACHLCVLGSNLGQGFWQVVVIQGVKSSWLSMFLLLA